MQQKNLFKVEEPVHGGELRRGQRKTMRPLARKKPIHLVLKAKKNFGKHGPLVQTEARRLADWFQIRIYDEALAPDHLHLVIRIPGRKEYIAFIRALTGPLARQLGKGIWSLLPFTRVSAWGKAFEELRKYLKKNREETAGLRPYEKRQDWYKKYRKKPG